MPAKKPMMKRYRLKCLITVFVAATLGASPLLLAHADARGVPLRGVTRGFGTGGFSGGSFRGGGAAVKGPGGTSVERRPAAGSKNANVNVNRNVTVNQGWGAWGGSHRPGAVAAGVAVGATVATLPSAYRTVVVNSQTYYVSEGTYYQQCYQGADVRYCVVANPNP